MKLSQKLLSLVLVALFSCSAAMAAASERFGLLAGLDIVSFSTPGSDSSAHFTGGVLYENFQTPLFSLQPELRYTNKSAGTASYDFLTLPVLFKGHIPTHSKVTPNVAIGPDFNVKLSGPTGFRTFIFALDFGAGVDAEIQQDIALSFDFRYSLGLTDVVSGIDSKTREIALLFGLKYAL